MLSPAFLRLCCLAVMAPALTKAVRQADGFTFMLMSDKNGELLPPRAELPFVEDRALSEDEVRRTANGCGPRNGALVANGDLWHPGPYNGDKLKRNSSSITPSELKNASLTPRKTPNNVNGHCSLLHAVGVEAPTFKHYNLNGTMNEGTSRSKESMGLLNANTSLDSDFQAKNYLGQFSSPVCLDEMSSHGSEQLENMLERCHSNPPLSLPGSPKSASGESTSTVTAHNPPVVTFAELAEVKSSYEKYSTRANDLLMRLRKLQILQVDKHVSSQVKLLFDHYQKEFAIPCQRQVKPNAIRRMKDSVDLKAEFLQNEDVRNLSTAALVNLVRKLESSSSTSNPSNRSLLPNAEGSCDKDNLKLSASHCKQIKQVTGCLLMRVKHMEAVMDSDATDSSSGGESCDEYEGYDDKKTNTTSIHKRALWTWVFDRAPIAKRWTWLQSQVHDLEYRVRQISDLLTQARSAKGMACFGEVASEPVSLTDHPVSLKKSLKSVNGYVGHNVASNSIHSIENVPAELYLDTDKNVGNSSFEDCYSASRTRPFKSEVFRKRKLLYTAGLHYVSRKAARLSTVKCSCNNRCDVLPCILCCGRYNNTQSVDPNVMPLLERVALLKPSYHPVLSFEKDIPLSLHFENHLRQNETYYHAPKTGTLPLKKAHFGMKPRSILDHARHHSRRLTKHAAQTLLSSARYRNNRTMSSKLRNRGLVFARWKGLNKGSFKKKRFQRWSAVSSCSSRQESPVHSPAVLDDGREAFDMRKRRDGHQYDIDNIVIPYNMKTATSFQKPQYKEIITPKWRCPDSPELERVLYEEFEPPENDSDDTFIKRHEKLELAERKIVRGGGSSNLNSVRRARRNFRQDSLADSSGANTPDHIPYIQQDIMFQDSNSFISGGPASPALSPPATPGSANTISDDSQPSGSNTTAPSAERKRTTSLTKKEEDEVQEDIHHPPFETRVFPLTEEVWEQMVQVSTVMEEESLLDKELVRDEEEVSLKDPSSPESPDTSSSTSSAFEDEDDTADPEWTVVRRQNGPDRTLVIKLAKR